MAFEAKVTGGEKCAHCNGEWRWRPCGACRGHGRLPLTVDLRGYRGEAHQITNLPAHFVYLYDTIKCDPPDRRSPMIQALDGKGWRESLETANRNRAMFWTYAEKREYLKKFDVARRQHDLDNLEKALPYLLDVPKLKCPLIRMLDDPAWRESLKVAETPVAADSDAMRYACAAAVTSKPVWGCGKCIGHEDKPLCAKCARQFYASFGL